jgi:hypothetical protein
MPHTRNAARDACVRIGHRTESETPRAPPLALPRRSQSHSNWARPPRRFRLAFSAFGSCVKTRAFESNEAASGEGQRSASCRIRHAPGGPGPRVARPRPACAGRSGRAPANQRLRAERTGRRPRAPRPAALTTHGTRGTRRPDAARNRPSKPQPTRTTRETTSH